VDLYEGAELELMLGMFAALSEYLVTDKQKQGEVFHTMKPEAVLHIA
jgi:hypothetical protein